MRRSSQPRFACSPDAAEVWRERHRVGSQLWESPPEPEGRERRGRSVQRRWLFFGASLASPQPRLLGQQRACSPRTDRYWSVKPAVPSRASRSLGWLRSTQWDDRCGQRRINLVQEPGAPDGPAMGRGRPWPSPSCRLLGSPAHASRARDPPRRPLAASSAASPGWRRRQQAKFATLSHPTAQRRRWYHGV